MARVMPSAAAAAAAAAERTTFVGVVVPPAIKKLAKALQPLSPAVQAELLQIAAQLLGDNSGAPAKDLTALAQEAKADEEVVQQAFAGLYALVRAALRIPPGQIKKNAFNEDLDTLNVPVELKAPITKLVFGPGRAALQPALDSSIVQRSKLNSMQWRVDVSISTSSLKRTLKPSLLLQLRLSDGRTRTFEVPIDKFHQLRYNTAFVLKELLELEKKQVVMQG